MLIATDGACKRNGQPTCSSSGVSWIQTEDGQLLYVSRFETCSTSQRGELNGLLEGLKYAVMHAATDEDIIIITDSEYLYNSVEKSWCMKWRANDWRGASGDEVKNVDKWEAICRMLDLLPDRVFMQWTKGHILPYTPGNTKAALRQDPTGVALYTNILSVASRVSEQQRIIKDFLRERVEHDKGVVPDMVALSWVVANTTADCLASFIVQSMDAQIL